MLEIDLRELAGGPVDTQANLAPNDPLFEGLGLSLVGPIGVVGRLQATGEERFYWHGTVRAAVTGECRRCLAPVTVPVTAEVGALFTREADALEDPDSYPLSPRAPEIDLRPVVREELVLAVPRYVVCREECRGLCPRCGKDLNAGPCGCAPAPDLRWRALADLKGKLPE